MLAFALVLGPPGLRRTIATVLAAMLWLLSLLALAWGAVLCASMALRSAFFSLAAAALAAVAGVAVYCLASVVSLPNWLAFFGASSFCLAVLHLFKAHAVTRGRTGAESEGEAGSDRGSHDSGAGE